VVTVSFVRVEERIQIPEIQYRDYALQYKALADRGGGKAILSDESMRNAAGEVRMVKRN